MTRRNKRIGNGVSGDEHQKKRRTKTGCLTCRTRRVKCDERKPACNRCETANLECAGYEGKRRLQIRRPRRPPIYQGEQAAGGLVPTFSGRVDVPPSPIFRADGLPLVGLPVNPTPSQRPHSRARDILAYHQFLFRTCPALFPFDRDHVWRDYLCEAAWEVEYVYDAIIALGSMHRATLLLSRGCKDDQHRGIDTKVIAVQAYTKAFQGLAEELSKSQRPKVLVVGVLVLFAFFEVLRALTFSPYQSIPLTVVA
ncbi:hypothetical protein N7468_003157 [Penicillium chermesinum]|uniref:Zn(2)-C6 fungal-type domain-containing protein n=1 Tax=Penicillium chermesinum TaxID=63820 RepID=A0A9W9TRZ4_9EURO|nr:uncharacterized protein N7468_003157 [Penicillium chermesinum]KAJ5238538.1 hypothetical protein N7468_003157 [Penicillium chermesinum]